jgi:hypothetical protein
MMMLTGLISILLAPKFIQEKTVSEVIVKFPNIDLSDSFNQLILDLLTVNLLNLI